MLFRSNAANAYTGLTTVSAGSLTYGINNAISTGDVTINGSTAILALGTYTDTVGAVTLTAGSITGTGSSTQGILTSTSGFTLNPTTGVTVSVSANLAGSVNLTHSGAGTANLSGYNAYTGTTTLSTSGGVLAITGSGTLSGTSSGVYSGAISIGTGTTFKYSSSANQTLQTGVISGAGNLTKDTDTSSVLTLTATNTYTGVTTINAGTISVGTIGNGGAAGNLGQATNASTNIVLGGGTLKYTGSTATSDRAFTITAGTTGTIDVPTGVTLTLAGATGTTTTGALTKTNSGTLNLSGVNTYTGTTTISAGTLAITGSGSLNSGSYAGSIVDNATFIYSSSATQTLSGVISGTGALTKDTDTSSVLTLSNTKDRKSTRLNSSHT